MGDVGKAALPPGWAWAKLGEVCEFSPGLELAEVEGDAMMPFVGMAAVEALTNKIEVSEARPFNQVATGFTRFRAGDILFAKITPCMENGKIAVVPIEAGPAAFGSTEFHVLRPHSTIDARYIRYYLVQQSTRDQARAVMSGAVGQQRVPKGFLQTFSIPVPPSLEQQRIATALDALFAEMQEAETAMKRARGQMSDYRASLLHAACTGALTADWRAANPHPAEDGPALLRRILLERRAAWEQIELARLTAVGKVPKEKVWKARYPVPLPIASDDLPPIPTAWTWASLDQLASEKGYGTSAKCDVAGNGPPVLRIPNVQAGEISFARLKMSRSELGLAARDYLSVGDLLVVRTNGSPALIGRAALIERAPASATYFASYLIRFRLISMPTLQKWISRMFASGLIRSQVIQFAATSAGQYNISQSSLARFAIPLPPIAEMEAALNLLSDEQLTPIDMTDGGEIADLRQSILHAAFSGRLVPQHPADEPAAALLARLRAEAAPPRRRTVRTKAPRP